MSCSTSDDWVGSPASTRRSTDPAHRRAAHSRASGGARRLRGSLVRFEPAPDTQEKGNLREIAESDLLEGGATARTRPPGLTEPPGVDNRTGGGRASSLLDHKH